MEICWAPGCDRLKETISAEKDRTLRKLPKDTARMGILQLFEASSVPVLNVLLVTCVGSVLATNRVNILGEDARKHLNNIVFYVFNPSLVSVNLAKTITFESLALLWFMPVNICLSFFIGSALGWFVSRITKAPAHLKGLLIGCCSAGNLGNILFVIIPAMCKEKGSPFGAPDVCHTYGLAYSSLSMAIGAVFLWAYVYNIVRTTSVVKESNGYTTNAPSPAESAKLLPGSRADGTDLAANGSLYDHSKDESGLPLSSFEDHSATARTEAKFSVRMKHILGALTGINWKRMFAPSTIGVIIGFVIGLIPQIRNMIVGESAPLRMVEGSAAILGDGAIPAVTLIMGGNLIRGLRGSDIRSSLVIGVVVVRFIILPAIGVAIVKGAIYLGLVHSDPLYQFILFLQHAVPPAMNIGTITQLFGAGESECSVIFLWTYGLASVSLTLWSTFFMWLVLSAYACSYHGLFMPATKSTLKTLDFFAKLFSHQWDKINEISYFCNGVRQAGNGRGNWEVGVLPVGWAWSPVRRAVARGRGSLPGVKSARGGVWLLRNIVVVREEGVSSRRGSRWTKWEEVVIEQEPIGSESSGRCGQLRNRSQVKGDGVLFRRIGVGWCWLEQGRKTHHNVDVMVSAPPFRTSLYGTDDYISTDAHPASSCDNFETGRGGADRVGMGGGSG
ncbi:hypothetical protein Taro_003249 [Colocasia esculenta]|uniref:PIN-like protein n=1 Tax=Colocasia esculenta TaxID=4460 RepID=A0A843TR91_COLES|nr:hypothetical protein [Colocasia esculenta]